jgi:hypothetical protein
VQTDKEPNIRKPVLTHRLALGSPDLDVGGRVGLQLLTSREWIHRKVDAIQFTGDMRLRRHVSVDFQVLPFADDGFKQLLPRRWLVPLAVLNKGLMLGFNLRDEGGAAVPILTSDENTWVSWSVLSFFASQALGTNEDPLDDAEHGALRDVAAARPDEVDSVIRAIQDHPRLWAIHQSPLLYAGLRTLAKNFLLLAAVDPDAGPRRVYKYSHEVDLSDQVQRFKLLPRLGLMPATLTIDVPRIDSRSTHIETVVPIGLQIARKPRAKVVDGAGGVSETKASSAFSAGVGHVHLSSDDSFRLDKVPSASIEFAFYPTEHGLVRIAFVMSALVLMLTSAANARLDLLVKASDASVAVLLGIVGALTLFIVRPGEHQFVSQLMAPYRAVVTLVGAFVPLAGAISLVIDSSPRMLTGIWLGLTLLADVCTGWLALIWLNARAMWRSSD